MDETERGRLREYLALVSPGTALRDGLERIVHGRTGADGRESLLLLSASHWGGHHHLDSLNLSR